MCLLGLGVCTQVLYAGEPEYESKTQELLGLILLELDKSISELSEQPDAPSGRALASVAMTFFETTLSSADLTTSTLNLAMKLFGIACKSAHVEKPRLRAIQLHVGKLAAGQGGAYQDLSARMETLRPLERR